MKSRTPSSSRPWCLSFALIASVLLLSPTTSWSGTPVVDDTTFIVNAGTYKAPIGDMDLLILREQYSAAALNLTAFDNPDPAETVITGNPTTLTFGSPDCVQSILVRFFDAASATIYRASSGTITFTDGVGTDVRILGVISDINSVGRLQGSDLVFQSSLVAGILDTAPYRYLENFLPPKDTVAISGDRKSVTFTVRTSAGADDFRIILDYGNGVCPTSISFPNGDFPSGVKFNVNLVDNIDTVKGVRIGETEYGEAISVTGIPLTAAATPVAQSPTRLPDVNFFGHTRGRDTNNNYGGEDDHLNIYYVAVDPVLGGNPGPDFYVWVLDGDNDAAANGTTTGTDDVATGGVAGQSKFEYMLFGGAGAATNNDVIAPGGGDPIDFGGDGDPTNDFSGTLIDINSIRDIDQLGLFNSAKTLITGSDTGSLSSQLRDQDWTIIGVDLDATPGYTIPTNPAPGSLDEQLAGFFGSGRQIYKLIVDGRDVRNQGPVGGEADFNRYQVDVSTSSADPNLGDCAGINPVINCVVPFAYEMVFAGRPQAQIPIVTETFILVPSLILHQLDIQTLDLDEATNGGALGAQITGTSARVIRSADQPNQNGGTGGCPFPLDNTSPDSCTFESGNQLPSNTDITYLWTSLNQTERTTGSAFPAVKDGATCGPGPYASITALCYGTVNHENVLWKVAIDPVAPVNPYGLRAFTDNVAAALVPVAPSPPDTQPPTPPTLAASPVTSTQIDLSWSGATDNVGIGSYRIYRVDPNNTTIVLGLLTTVSGSVTSYVDAGRTPGTTYCYQVTAVDLSSNQSNPSNVACATTPSGDTTPPSAPTLTATPVNQTQIDASWTAATDVGTGVAGYRLYRCVAPNTTTDCTASGGTLLIDTMNPTVLSYPNTGLTASTRYCYVVRAYDGANNLSAFSNNACATTPASPPPPDTTPPSVPSLTTTAVISSEIDLSWTASSDPGGSGVASYEIFRCQVVTTDCSAATVGTLLTTVTSPTVAYNNIGLTPSTRYCYAVRAYDVAGNPSGFSNNSCATTFPPPPSAPSAPSPFSATAASQTQINLAWGASNPNGGTITSYQIYFCSPGPCTPSTSGVPLATVSGSTLTYPNTGLMPNTTYCYVVTATDSEALTSPPSTVACATTPADTSDPSIPADLDATAMSSSQIYVSWEGSTDNVGVVGYRLYRRIGTSGTLTYLTTVLTTIYSDIGLTASTTYCYYVTAVDGSGNESNPSNIDCATTFTVGGFEPATIMITPVTINLGTSGIPINVFISFDQTVPGAHVAQDICITGVNMPTGCPTDVTVYKIRMHFPPLANSTIPTPIDHMSGTEIFTGSNSLNVKFRRADVEARLEPANDVVLEVRGLLKDGHNFSGTDTVTVNP